VAVELRNRGGNQGICVGQSRGRDEGEFNENS